MSKGCWLFAVLAVHAAGVAASSADRAGNRIESLSPSREPPGGAGKWMCVPDRRWCANVDAAGRLHTRSVTQPAVTIGHDAAWGAADGEVEFRLWPMAIGLADGAEIFGVLREVSSGYSGGEARATELQLFEVRDRQQRSILRVPVAGEASIRACFSEKDEVQRAGACSDRYTFAGDLSLDENTRQGPPVLRFTTRASSYPGHVSRSRDSLAAPPLHKKDLVTVTDPRCSFHRLFRMDPATRRYRPNAPLPSCEDYTVP